MRILRYCADCGQEEFHSSSDKCDNCGGRMTDDETENLEDKTIKIIKKIRLRKVL